MKKLIFVFVLIFSMSIPLAVGLTPEPCNDPSGCESGGGGSGPAGSLSARFLNVPLSSPKTIYLNPGDTFGFQLSDGFVRSRWRYTEGGTDHCGKAEIHEAVFFAEGDWYVPLQSYTGHSSSSGNVRWAIGVYAPDYSAGGEWRTFMYDGTKVPLSEDFQGGLMYGKKWNEYTEGTVIQIWDNIEAPSSPGVYTITASSAYHHYGEFATKNGDDCAGVVPSSSYLDEEFDTLTVVVTAASCTYANQCDIDAPEGPSCDRSVSPHNACSLSSNIQCRTEDDSGAAACSDTVDNDCDGLLNCEDPDCSGYAVCDCTDPSTDEGHHCPGNPGDRTTDENTDGIYCDTTVSPGRCCPVGEEWDPVTQSCVDAGLSSCYTSPCPYDMATQPSQWWSDPSCYVVQPGDDAGCCFDGVEFGEKRYYYEDAVPY